MFAASSPARNTTAAATSAGVLIRRDGMRASTGRDVVGELLLAFGGDRPGRDGVDPHA